MEGATRGILNALQAYTQKGVPEEALLEFVRQLELDCAQSRDIALFVFGVRCFFCWHRAAEIAASPAAIAKIRATWMNQNDGIYTEWLASCEDDPDFLKWGKWTFQAKNAILDEFCAANKPTAATS
jgi:hypothetical protein